MRDGGYQIRTMTRKEIDQAVAWAGAEGWNPGQNDAACFHAAAPEGFLAGVLHGELVASISAVPYGDDFGFIGFYIVRPEHRGRGLGLRIWNAALEHLQGRTLGLDGVPDQQHNYKASGFALAWRNIRQQGRVGDVRHHGASQVLVALAELPLAEVAAYDRQLFPAARQEFLACWLSQPGGRALGIQQQGRLAGYGVLRPCLEGWKVGPLFADSAGQAASLLQGLLQDLPPEAVYYLDTPEPNTAALELALSGSMRPVFETARMYRGPTPTQPLERLFGVTSFELG